MRWRTAAPLILVTASLVSLLFATRSGSVPLYAAQTGLACATCHFDPNGGGPRNEFGFNFARQRHRLEPEEGKAWSDVELVNRVGETFPLYVGIDHRLMLLTDQTDAIPGVDRVGFYNMENALHLAFQPHKMLTLVYTRDGFDQGSKSQDAFGMIGGGPWASYLKAGRFRTPFGLRMDDHTVATRNGFLDILAGGASDARFLPFDPRSPDMGIEVGAERSGFFGRASFTNGESHPLSFGAARAQAKTIKVGYTHARFQGGASFYDDFRDGVTFGPRRATRWSAYGMTHVGPLAAIAEFGAGTDEYTGLDDAELSAGFAELDYTPMRWINLRARYDRLDIGPAPTALPGSEDVFQRYAFEADVVPVPFAELRATVRRIEPEDGPGEETQGYLQFHFSY